MGIKAQHPLQFSCCYCSLNQRGTTCCELSDMVPLHVVQCRDKTVTQQWNIQSFLKSSVLIVFIKINVFMCRNRFDLLLFSCFSLSKLTHRKHTLFVSTLNDLMENKKMYIHYIHIYEFVYIHTALSEILITICCFSFSGQMFYLFWMWSFVLFTKIDCVHP